MRAPGAADVTQRHADRRRRQLRNGFLRLISAHLKPAYDALPSIAVPAGLLRDLKTVFQL